MKNIFDIYCENMMRKALDEFDEQCKIRAAHEEYEAARREEEMYKAAAEREDWLRDDCSFELEEAIRVLSGEWDDTPLERELEGIRHSLRRMKGVHKYLQRRREFRERGGEENRSISHSLHSHGMDTKLTRKTKRPSLLQKRTHLLLELEEEKNACEENEAWWDCSYENSAYMRFCDDEF